MAVLTEALAFVEKTGECYLEAELHRVKGDLLLAQGHGTSTGARFRQAESSFQRAIEVARYQSAKSWELRATTSLARLWQQQSQGVGHGKRCQRSTNGLRRGSTPQI